MNDTFRLTTKAWAPNLLRLLLRYSLAACAAACLSVLIASCIAAFRASVQAGLTLVGSALLAALIVVYLKLRSRDEIASLMSKRRPTAHVVARADYLEGRERIPVALSIASDTLYYENPDLEASFELDRLDEIEYSDESAAGKQFDDAIVLRLRSHGATFEFLLNKHDGAKFKATLPPRSRFENEWAKRGA